MPGAVWHALIAYYQFRIGLSVHAIETLIRSWMGGIPQQMRTCIVYVHHIHGQWTQHLTGMDTYCP